MGVCMCVLFVREKKDAFVAEERKHKDDTKCAKLGVYVGVETYRWWDTEAKWALSQLISRLTHDKVAQVCSHHSSLSKFEYYPC